MSPDGKLLAYASDRNSDGNLDIWLQQVGKGEATRLTADPADDREPAFSPDGTRIAFRSERQGGGIYVVSALGGPATLIAAQGRRPRFSPDGNWIAYWAGIDFSRTYVVAATGGAPRRLAPEFAVARFPVWSPDGQHILFLGAREQSTTAINQWEWWIAPLGAAPAVQTAALSVLREHGLPSTTSRNNAPLLVLSPAAWTASGHVIFAADTADTRNLWQLAVSPTNRRVTGSPQRLTFGTGTEDLPSIAGHRIAFSHVTANINIWSLPIDPREGLPSGELRRMTEATSMDIQPAISADGQRLVFASDRAGKLDIWVKDLRTGGEAAATMSPRFESRPAVTPDGSKIAYNDWEGQLVRLNVVSLDDRSEGAIPEKVCDECFLAWDWSPDNRTLLYWSLNRRQIGLLDISSREKAIILKHQYSLLRPSFSPTGRWIAFEALVGPDRTQLFIAPFQGMRAIDPDTWIPVMDERGPNSPHWTPDSNSLYFLSPRDGYLCFWRQRLDPETKRPFGEAKPVYHLHGARRSISNVPPSYLEIAVARDKIVFPMGERTGNIWLAEWKP